MGRFEDYPGLVGTGVQLLENRLGAIPQGFESLSLPITKAGRREVFCFLSSRKRGDSNGLEVNECRWHSEPTLTEPAGENESLFLRHF